MACDDGHDMTMSAALSCEVERCEGEARNRLLPRHVPLTL